MAIGLTFDEVRNLDPCSGSFKRVSRLLGGKTGWNGNRIDAAKAREAGCTFDDIVWVASALARENPDVERRLRLWMADCAARVLHIYEKTESSPAPRNAIVAARQFARGEIDDAAGAAGAARAAGDAARAAWAAARAAGAAGAAWAAWAAAGDAAGAAAGAARAARDAAGDAARAAEEAWQFDRLIAWLSDDEPQDWPLPALKQAEAA